MTLDDLTRHRSFTKRLHAAHVDTTSAEWILEAPTVCTGVASCHTLPLADFGSAGFTAASAVTTTGHRGSITDRQWTATRISLAAGGRQFVSAPGGVHGHRGSLGADVRGQRLHGHLPRAGDAGRPGPGQPRGRRPPHPSGALTKFLGRSYVPLPEGPDPVM